MELNEIFVKEWYIKEFPDDTCGDDLLEEVTFKDVLNSLQNKEDIYKTLFRRSELGDSVIRELVFKKLSELINKDYNYIYNLWLKGENN